jgi:hypothetical protein
MGLFEQIGKDLAITGGLEPEFRKNNVPVFPLRPKPRIL